MEKLSARQLRDLTATLVSCIPLNLTGDLAEAWIKNPQALRLLLEGLYQEPTKDGQTPPPPIPRVVAVAAEPKPLPAEGEIFTLYMDADKDKPMGEKESKVSRWPWVNNGLKKKGPQMAQFKLIRLPRGVSDASAARAEALNQGVILAEPQWQMAFHRLFPQSGGGEIAFGGVNSGWMSPVTNTRFWSIGGWRGDRYRHNLWGEEEETVRWVVYA